MDALNMVATVIWVSLLLYVGVKFARSIRLVPTQKAYIVERLGRYHMTLGPGFHMLIPFVDRVAFIKDLREVATEVPPQDCFTKDNVQVEVDGVIYMSIVNPENASYGIVDCRYAAAQLAQTTTRSVIGTLDLDQTFEERDVISSRVVAVLSEVSDAWGILVHRYELKNIVPPASVREAMERQMNSERDRRALLARVEGDKQSRINASEGQKMELINRSEGEMQRRINEAQGRAQEILSVAKATADSIRTIGAAIVQPGGKEAINLQLKQAYLDRIALLGRPQTSIVLPADLTDFNVLLSKVGLGDDIHIELRPGYVAPRTTQAATTLGQPAAQMQAYALSAPPETEGPSTMQMPAIHAHDD